MVVQLFFYLFFWHVCYAVQCTCISIVLYSVQCTYICYVSDRYIFHMNMYQYSISNPQVYITGKWKPQMLPVLQ